MPVDEDEKNAEGCTVRYTCRCARPTQRIPPQARTHAPPRRRAAAAAAADLKQADTIWENLVLRSIGETVNTDEWTKLVGVRVSKKVRAAAVGCAAGCALTRACPPLFQRGPGKDVRFEMWLTATKPEKFKDEFAGICQVNRKGLDPTRYHPGNPNHKETPHRGVKPRKSGRR